MSWHYEWRKNDTWLSFKVSLKVKCVISVCLHLYNDILCKTVCESATMSHNTTGTHHKLNQEWVRVWHKTDEGYLWNLFKRAIIVLFNIDKAAEITHFTLIGQKAKNPKTEKSLYSEWIQKVDGITHALPWPL